MPSERTEIYKPDHIARLLIKHRSSLLAFIVAAVRDFDAAEDLFQDVAIAIWENAASYEPGSNFGAWSRAFARRRIAAHWRARSRVGQSLSDEHLDYVIDGFEQLQTDINPEVRSQALFDCLGQLKPFTSRAFHLRYSQQLSLGHVAEKLGRQPDTIRKTLYRGRMLLRECIERKLAIAVGEGSDP